MTGVYNNTEELIYEMRYGFLNLFVINNIAKLNSNQQIAYLHLISRNIAEEVFGGDVNKDELNRIVGKLMRILKSFQNAELVITKPVEARTGTTTRIVRGYILTQKGINFLKEINEDFDRLKESLLS